MILTYQMESVLLAYKYLPSSKFLETRLQVVHRSYLTPARGHHMGIYPTSNCFNPFQSNLYPGFPRGLTLFLRLYNGAVRWLKPVLHEVTRWIGSDSREAGNI
ncbi:hypothetical protein GDO78_017246 [Eleutherodactylus coqui]|uniref:Uncharacterized protein n=1 Tax=Eleutherodactylus coqui TaxID=57060 RepID=A0A8J6BD36_ELECQ|nr:hypothetical protein GDO78_017246 [Eleutherodactylus coqui]